MFKSCLTTGCLLCLMLAGPAAAAKTKFTVDATATAGSYNLKEQGGGVDLNGLMVGGEVGGLLSMDKLLAKLDFGLGTSVGDTQFTRSSYALTAGYPLSRGVLLFGGYRGIETNIDYEATGANANQDVVVNVSGPFLGISTRFPMQPLSLSLSYTPFTGKFENETLGSNLEKSGSGFSYYLTYAFKAYRLSVASTIYDTNAFDESTLELKLTILFK